MIYGWLDLRVSEWKVFHLPLSLQLFTVALKQLNTSLVYSSSVYAR